MNKQHKRQLRALLNQLKRTKPESAKSKVEAEIVKLKHIVDAIPEDKRLCCNPAWYKPYTRLQHLNKLASVLEHEGL